MKFFNFKFSITHTHSATLFCVPGVKVSGVGWCNASYFGIFLNLQLTDCFWKIWRICKCFIAVVLTDCRQVQWFYCCSCLVPADCWEAEAVLADVLAAWWWLEERWRVGAGQVVKWLWCDLLVAHPRL